jgi:hypothetical protein
MMTKSEGRKNDEESVTVVLGRLAEVMRMGYD